MSTGTPAADTSSPARPAGEATPPARTAEELGQFRHAARHMGVERMRDGSWFRRLVGEHVRKHAAAIGPDHWDKVYPGLDVEARAHRRIVSVSRRAAMTGACASIGASTGELLSLLTEGLAAPVGLPAAALSMALEAGYTALLQVDLVCDLASLYGVPFDPNDVGEVATLFGLALEIDTEAKEAEGGEGDDEEAPKGLMAALVELENGDVAKRIGRKLLEDAVMKNVVPVLGVAISARWNYVATRKLAAAVRRYVRYRRALRHALGKLRLANVTDPVILVEGAWLLATVDGSASREETMALAAIVDTLPEDKRCALALDRALAEDEEEWFEDLKRVPREDYAALVDVLYLVGASDRSAHEAERRFLRRVARTLDVEIDFDRLGQICRHLAHGDELPDGVLRCA